MAKGTLFNHENWVWKPFSYVADVVLLSGMWFLCSVPLITLGATTAAAYDVAARCIRGADRGFFSRFFRTFKQEWKLATLSLLLWALILAGGYGLVRWFGNSVTVNDTTVMLTTAGLLLLSVILGIACWVPAVQSRFAMPFGQLNVMAVKLALANMPRTMALGILTTICGWLCLQFWVPFLFLPGVMLLLWTLLLEPVFSQYTDDSEEE